MAQIDLIRKHLKEQGKLTSWEAITKYRITRLSAIIYTLRHTEQMEITSKDRRNEDGKNWVEYRYLGYVKPDDNFELFNEPKKINNNPYDINKKY